MDAQDKRMCTDVDYYNQVYDDDVYLGDIDILNIFDYPVETLEGDGLVEDWAAKLGPIPPEVFKEEMMPPVSTVNGGGYADSLPESCVLNDTKSQPRSFEAPSPDSVLHHSTSSSAPRKRFLFGTEVSVPSGRRSKRSRPAPTESIWSKSTFLIDLQKGKKKQRRNFGQQQQHGNNEMKKCSHCEITKTPQWREGPMGPKTLCNACGVRYRSGRLFPEYRPAASPSFVPALHSNSHRKVIEMRMKGGDCFRKNGWGSNLIDTS